MAPIRWRRLLHACQDFICSGSQGTALGSDGQLAGRSNSSVGVIWVASAIRTHYFGAREKIRRETMDGCWFMLKTPCLGWLVETLSVVFNLLDLLETCANMRHDDERQFAVINAFMTCWRIDCTHGDNICNLQSFLEGSQYQSKKKKFACMSQ